MSSATLPAPARHAPAEVRAASPALVRELTEQVYLRLGPVLGTHSLCRAVASIAAGVAAGLGVPAEVVFDQHYSERAVRSPHFWVEFEDGSRLDAWMTRKVRLRPAP